MLQFVHVPDFPDLSFRTTRASPLVSFTNSCTLSSMQRQGNSPFSRAPQLRSLDSSALIHSPKTLHTLLALDWHPGSHVRVPTEYGNNHKTVTRPAPFRKILPLVAPQASTITLLLQEHGGCVPSLHRLTAWHLSVVQCM